MPDRHRHAPMQHPKPADGEAAPTADRPLTIFHGRRPDPARIFGFLTLVVSGVLLLLLAGLSVAAVTTGLVIATPLLLFTSPIWVPLGAFLFVSVSGFLSCCTVGVLLLAGGYWLCKKRTAALGTPGPEWLHCARGKISDAANHVKGYAAVRRGCSRGTAVDAGSTHGAVAETRPPAPIALP